MEATAVYSTTGEAMGWRLQQCILHQGIRRPWGEGCILHQGRPWGGGCILHQGRPWGGGYSSAFYNRGGHGVEATAVHSTSGDPEAMG